MKDGVVFWGYGLPDFGDIELVNFNIKEELEQDMFNQLMKYVSVHNLNLFEWYE